MCGEYEVKTIPKLSHTHSYTSSETTPASCGVEGLMTYTCACGDVYTETIPALEHNYVQVGVTEPTCTEAGRTGNVCTLCGKAYTETISPALGHDVGDWEVQEAASYARPGTKVKKCSRCDYIVETGTIPQKEPLETSDITIDMGNGETQTVIGFYDREMEQEIFDMINEIRVSKGYDPLKRCNAAQQAQADIRSAECVVNYSHTRPSGANWNYDPTYSLGICAENIAAGYTTSKRVMAAWMNSAGHASNILSSSNFIGVSVFVEAKPNEDGTVSYRYTLAQVFFVV